MHAAALHEMRRVDADVSEDRAPRLAGVGGKRARGRGGRGEPGALADLALELPGLPAREAQTQAPYRAE
jgi:hypothetical protein